MAFELKTKAAVVKLIDGAIAHTTKGDMIIHEAAVQALAWADPAVKHGDATLIDRLIKGLGRSVRVEGLKVWVAEYSPVRWNGDGKVGLLKTTMKGYKPFDMEGAAENPFWTLAGADERTARPLDVSAILKVIHGLKGRVEKAVKEGKFEGDHVAALNLVESVESFTDGYVANHPDVTRDGNFDPNDPENAKLDAPKPKRARKAKDDDNGQAPPATTPRRARRVPQAERTAA